MSWALEKDGCESEFIVGHFENRICMFAQAKFESRFGSLDVFFQIYPLILTLHANFGYQDVSKGQKITTQ